MTDRAERCETCRFYEAEVNHSIPICRRYAPRAVLFRREDSDDDYKRWVTWPCVLPTDWCGEWQMAQ